MNEESANSCTAPATRVKWFISITCALLAIAHLASPNLQIDSTTLVLLVLGLIPWFASIIRSVELPGGLKIELKDVKAATEKVAAGSVAPNLTEERRNSEGLEFLGEVGRSDPNLAIVGLRIEIERRLSRLATLRGLPIPNRSAGALLRKLVAADGIDQQSAAGLNELIALGNQAAHGAVVAPNAAAWAMDKGPLILGTLDNLITLASSDNRRD